MIYMLDVKNLQELGSFCFLAKAVIGLVRKTTKHVFLVDSFAFARFHVDF